MKEQIVVKELLEQINHYEALTTAKTQQRVVTTSEISRAGLSIIGYNEFFPYYRIQVYGHQEYEHLKENEHIWEEKYLLNEQTPLIIFAHGLVPPQAFIDKAEEKNIAIIASKENTTLISARIHEILSYELAQTTRIHGVLLNILGTGVIIKGKSGIGKSEVALELVQKGYFLVADDAVEIRKTADNKLIGEAPELLKNRMEIRGVGIVDIQKLYGVTSVLPKNRIDLIIELQDFTNTEDRIGNKYEYENILDVDVRKVVLPVSKGRSIANMVEVAVANYKLKSQYNYDSTKEFINDLENLLKK